MKKVNYLLLIFPISVFFAAFVVLAVNLFPAKMEQLSVVNRPSKAIDLKKPVNQPSAEKALPYFILASVFMVVLLVLPRIQELSISERSLVLKLISEVKEEARQLETETTINQQEHLTLSPVNHKALRIQEKLTLLEELLHRHK